VKIFYSRKKRNFKDQFTKSSRMLQFSSSCWMLHDKLKNLAYVSKSETPWLLF